MPSKKKVKWASIQQIHSEIESLQDKFNSVWKLIERLKSYAEEIDEIIIELHDNSLIMSDNIEEDEDDTIKEINALKDKIEKLEKNK